MNDLPLFRKLKDDLIDDGIIQKGARYVVGVSGGADSVFLFIFFLYLKESNFLEFSVAHFDHMLRRESGSEMKFCEELCRKYSIPFHTKQEDIAKGLENTRQSLEEFARERRHLFLEETRVSQQAFAIALGHHRDDQVETFFMRACRGCGLEGLAGIRPKRDRIIHPLIRLSKQEILSTLVELGQDYINDTSNFDANRVRNFFRLEILPRIAGRFPAVGQNVGRLCEILQEEDRVMDLMAQQGFEKCVLKTGKSAEIILEEFKNLELGIQRRILIKLLPDRRFELVERILHSLDSSGPIQKNIISEHGLVVTQNDCKLIFTEKKIIPTGRFQLEIDISGNQGAVSIPGTEYQLHWERAPLLQEKYKPNEIRVDCDKIGPSIEIRSRKPGDRINTMGMTGHIKVKKLMMEKRIPRQMRECIPLLVSGGEVKAIFFNLANSGLFNYISQDMSISTGTRNMFRFVLEKVASHD